jgi:hypothetical protein
MALVPATPSHAGLFSLCRYLFNPYLHDLYLVAHIQCRMDFPQLLQHEYLCAFRLPAPSPQLPTRILNPVEVYLMRVRRYSSFRFWLMLGRILSDYRLYMLGAEATLRGLGLVICFDKYVEFKRELCEVCTDDI